MPGSANTFFVRSIALLLFNYFFATVEDEPEVEAPKNEDCHHA